MQPNSVFLENQPSSGAIVMARGIFLLGPFVSFFLFTKNLSLPPSIDIGLKK